MKEYFNPDIAEKPDHTHYPVCQGRLEAIGRHGTKLFLYTFAVGCGLGLISFIGYPMHVVGWIPAAIAHSTDRLTVKLCVVQMFISLCITVLGFLGSGEHKRFNIVLMVIYLLMFICPIFYRFSFMDVIVFLLGGGGVIFSSSAVTDCLDYEQLARAEGFPSFSLILVENEEQKAHRPDFNKWYNKGRRTSAKQSSSDINAQGNSDIQLDNAASALGDMPELTIKATVQEKAPADRFMIKSGKAGGISDSGLKF